MGLLSYAMDKVFGRATLMLFVGDRPAVEIRVEGRMITAEVKSILLAGELGFSEFIRSLENRGDDPVSSMIKRLKLEDYTIKVKWGRLEVKI